MGSGAYYNENDLFAAQWLRNLIVAGHIADGEVDERSIVDVRTEDLKGFAQCHFFAGIGVWSHVLRLAGWSDDRPVWTGSCPCQPFSVAGSGKGTNDERHLWPVWERLIRECRPSVIVGEQVASPAALGWFDVVSADLEGEGYAVGAADLCAAGVGAPHIRQRLYWMAHAGRSPGSAEQLDEPGKGLRGEPGTDDGAGIGECCQALRLANSATGGQRIDGGAPWKAGHAPQRESACRLGDTCELRGGRDPGAVPCTQGEGSGQRGEAGGVPDELVHAGASRGLADTNGAGLERQDLSQPAGRRCDSVAAGSVDVSRAVNSDGRINIGCIPQPGRRPVATANGGVPAGFWANADWLACTDGKARPVEPGTFPLAHGATARVGRLRAYGNAICAPLAEEFMRVVMELAS